MVFLKYNDLNLQEDIYDQDLLEDFDEGHIFF